MKHLLIPIDGSECSIQAVTAIKQIFPPSHADVTLLTVREDVDSNSTVILNQMIKDTMPVLDKAASLLLEYNVNKVVDFGIAGNTILRYAKQHNIDIIIITKRTHSALSVFLGSVAVHLVKYGHCPVIVLPENHYEL
ncbi:universal stress protein [Acetanaerobacterium elongatum]|uniref:Nucleotide-binding universal stress protein, UspA family n=1 Tax=Acetanaerobacterium elongatum TaxID=258515 RepID=A0A1H0D891_9FIRM|nr:universal stress protein [Acetanaerobacterium elongatum]SDN66299.1 Nucleotide-binding universal stress protein, UspA family [Acetanaerobacterium elongatum]